LSGKLKKIRLGYGLGLSLILFPFIFFFLMRAIPYLFPNCKPAMPSQGQCEWLTALSYFGFALAHMVAGLIAIGALIVATTALLHTIKLFRLNRKIMATAILGLMLLAIVAASYFYTAQMNFSL
jgi:hypothetical protein